MEAIIIVFLATRPSEEEEAAGEEEDVGVVLVDVDVVFGEERTEVEEMGKKIVRWNHDLSSLQEL
jgi:hypothetical protein